MTWIRRRGRNFGLGAGTPIVFDPDAEAFFTAAGITNQAEKIAMNNFVVSTKSGNSWQKSSRIFPFSPTSSVASSYCMKSLTQFTYVNSPTWSAAGVAFSVAGNSYLNTGYNPNADGATGQHNFSHSGYVNDDATISSGNTSAISGSQNAPGRRVQWQMLTSGEARSRLTTGNIASLVESAGNTDYLGMWVGSRVSQTDHRIFRNGTQVGLDTSSNPGTAQSTADVYIGAYNNDGTPQDNFQGRICFYQLGQGLTVAEAQNLSAAAEALQQALGRAA